MAKVLVADDDRDLRGVIKLVLVSAGYQVTESRGGRRALEKAHQEQPDLILLGLSLSSSHAADALQELTEHPETSHIPVILLRPEGEDAPGTAQHQTHDFIKRPFSATQLESKVQLAIDKSRTAAKPPGAAREAGPAEGPSTVLDSTRPVLPASPDPSSRSPNPLEEPSPMPARADAHKGGARRALRESLPPAKYAVAVMLVLFGVVAFLAPMAFPVRGTVLGDFDARQLLGRLPFLDSREDDEDYQRWTPWLDCIGDSLGVIREDGLQDPDAGLNKTAVGTDQTEDNVTPGGPDAALIKDAGPPLPVPGC